MATKVDVVLNFLKKNSYITLNDIEKIFPSGKNDKAIRNLLPHLKYHGYLTQSGIDPESKQRRYTLSEKGISKSGSKTQTKSGSKTQTKTKSKKVNGAMNGQSIIPTDSPQPYITKLDQVQFDGLSQSSDAVIHSMSALIADLEKVKVENRELKKVIGHIAAMATQTLIK